MKESELKCMSYNNWFKPTNMDTKIDGHCIYLEKGTVTLILELPISILDLLLQNYGSGYSGKRKYFAKLKLQKKKNTKTAKITSFMRAKRRSKTRGVKPC